MKPSVVSAVLRSIAQSIEASKKPDKRLVVSAIRRVYAEVAADWTWVEYNPFDVQEQFNPDTAQDLTPSDAQKQAWQELSEVLKGQGILLNHEGINGEFFYRGDLQVLKNMASQAAAKPATTDVEKLLTGLNGSLDVIGEGYAGEI